jgi:hypothetical protein
MYKDSFATYTSNIKFATSGLLIIIKSGDHRDIVYISIFFILPQKLTQPLLSFFQDNANI